MKKYILKLLILTLVLLSLGCITNNHNNQSNGNLTYNITDKDPNTMHYEDSNISFDYPISWNLTTGKYSVSLYNGEKQVIIETPILNAASEFASATVPLPREIVSNETIEVDGLNAQKVLYKSKGDSLPSRIEINVIKNGKLFKIYGYAPPQEFNNAQKDFNLIINSLKLK